MKPGNYDLSLYRGDSYAWQFRLWADVGKTVPVDLTGATVKSEIRNDFAGSKIVALDCAVTLPNNVDVKMTAAMWAQCPNQGVWDLQVTFPDGEVRTVLRGGVQVTADVTDSVPA